MSGGYLKCEYGQEKLRVSFYENGSPEDILNLNVICGSGLEGTAAGIVAVFYRIRYVKLCRSCRRRRRRDELEHMVNTCFVVDKCLIGGQGSSNSEQWMVWQLFGFELGTGAGRKELVLTFHSP